MIRSQSLHKANRKRLTSTSATCKKRLWAFSNGSWPKALKLSLDRLDVDEPLETYGMDSILAMDLTAHLEKSFGALSKTLFFEVQSVQALSDYFVNQHPAELKQLLEPDVSANKTEKPAPAIQPISSARPFPSSPRQTAKSNPVSQLPKHQPKSPLSV